MDARDELHDERRVPFAMVESEFLKDPTFTPQEKALYSLLVTYGPQRIFPGQQTLADCLNVSRQSVIRWLNSLRSRGMIDWCNRIGTSNLYTILGYENVRSLEGVTPVVQGYNTHDTPPVTSVLHDLDPLNEIHLHISPDGEEISSPKQPVKKERQPTKQDSDTVTLEIIDSDDLEQTCPACEHPISVRELDTSRAVCPGCGRGVWVVDEGGRKVVKPPQHLRGKKRDSSGFELVRAFCTLARLDYGKLPPGTRTKWARQIRAVAGDNEVTPKIILGLDVWGIENLENPFQDRFTNALTAAIMGQQNKTADGRPIITVGPDPNAPRPMVDLTELFR